MTVDGIKNYNKWTMTLSRKAGGIPRVSIIFSLSVVENEHGRGTGHGQTCLARLNFQARAGTGGNKILVVQLTTSRIGTLTRLIHTLL